MRAKRARKAIRNYRSLKKKNQISSFLEIREKLYMTNLDSSLKGSSNWLMPGKTTLSEVSVRQLINLRRHYIGIQKELLTNPKNFCYPIPPEWFPILEKHDFVINRARSKFLWIFYLLAVGFLGPMRALKELYYSYKKKAAELGAPFVHFVKLQSSSIPSRSIKKQYTVIDWYTNWDGRNKTAKLIRHSAFEHSAFKINSYKLEGVGEDLPSLTPRRAILLLLWSFYALTLSLSDLLRGKWWMIFTLHEAVYAKKMSMLSVNSIAREYFFTHEHCIYKPLWTYVAESRGAVCSVYFYSTNCHSVKPALVREDFFRAFSYMNWQRYLVWNKEQKRKILSCGAKNNFLKPRHLFPVGPIYFQDSADNLPTLKQNTISVFDVSPSRTLFQATFGQHYEYYVPKTLKMFLQNIESLRVNLGFNVVLKLKRQDDKFYDQSYLNFVKKLESRGWTIISSNINARHLIEKTKMSIHFPFTSTGVIADAINKPSVYYDPTGKIDIHDTAMMGAILANDKKQLKKFVETHLSLR